MSRVRSSAQVREVLSNQVYRIRQVAGSRHDDAANIRRARERVGELEGRAGEIVEERHELGAEAPQRDAGQAAGIGEDACDARIERRLAAACGDGSRSRAPPG